MSEFYWNFQHFNVCEYVLELCVQKQQTRVQVVGYFYFYVHGSVHRWSILTIVRRDATQSILFIIVQVHSTCFGCQSYPSSGAARLAWPSLREVAAQKYDHYRRL